MLDSTLRLLIDPPLKSCARGIARTSFTGIQITIVGFIFGLIACILVGLQYGQLALVFLILNRICDGFDGAVARARDEASVLGGYLDITLDYFIYAGIPFCAAIGLMDQTAYLAAAFVLFSFIGSGVTFLAYSIMAEKTGMDDQAHQGKKSFYFAKGFMEGTETIIFMVLICLFPQWFEWICYGFGTLCWITAVARIHMATKIFA